MTNKEIFKIRKAIAYLASNNDEWDLGMEILFKLARLHWPKFPLKSIPINKLLKKETEFTYNHNKIFGNTK